MDHLCGQPDCVRVGHLEAVEGRENLRRCGKCKLTCADVIEIRRSNEQQHVLAERYGVTQGHISRIKAGLVWQDMLAQEVPTDAATTHLQTIDGASEELQDQALSHPPILKLAA